MRRPATRWDQSTDSKIEHVARSEQTDKSKTRHLGATSARESTTGRLAHEQSPDDEALRQGINRDRKPKSEAAKTKTGRRGNPEPTGASPRERRQKIQSSLLGHLSDELSEGKTSWCARAEPGRRRWKRIKEPGASKHEIDEHNRTGSGQCAYAGRRAHIGARKKPSVQWNDERVGTGHRIKTVTRTTNPGSAQLAWMKD
jgi:hypothetical protein